MYWSKLREVYTSYQEAHNPIMSHYLSLREKDDFYQKEIARNDLQIQLATVRGCLELGYLNSELKDQVEMHVKRRTHEKSRKTRKTVGPRLHS